MGPIVAYVTDSILTGKDINPGDCAYALANAHSMVSAVTPWRAEKDARLAATMDQTVTRHAAYEAGGVRQADTRSSRLNYMARLASHGSGEDDEEAIWLEMLQDHGLTGVTFHDWAANLED